MTFAKYKVGPNFVKVLKNYSVKGKFDKAMARKVLEIVCMLIEKGLNNLEICSTGLIKGFSDTLKISVFDKEMSQWVINSILILCLKNDEMEIETIIKDGIVEMFHDCLKRFDLCGHFKLFV